VHCPEDLPVVGSQTLLIEHFLITRFSYRASDASRNVASPTRKISEGPLNPERLDLRFKLFECTCLPSVKAQTDQGFQWIIIVDKDLPPDYRSRLETLLGGRSNYFIHTYDPEVRMDRLEWLARYFRGDQEPAYVLSTNLDDDDALPDNFVACVREHVGSAHSKGGLPPVKILGITQIMQWDMIASRDAPLGWRSPWHRGQRTSSCGYTLLVKYPELSFCVLGTKHIHAEHYFDFATPAKNAYVEERRSAFLAAAADHDPPLDRYSPTSLFHDLTPATGPVLMSNHAKNIQKWRLYENKSDRVPVTGPETFPNVCVDTDRFAAYAKDFGTSLSHRLKRFIGGYVRFRRPPK
jgi:hypothetical protein